MYGDSALSYTVIKFWAAEFKHDRTSWGHDKVHQMLLDTSRNKVREMAEAMKMSRERVVTC